MTLSHIYYLTSFSGGLSLQGNPWLCSCQNSWLGTWLRRWMRETLQLHASIIDRNHHIQTMVRTITCQVPIGVDRGFSWSAPVSSADKMQMAATAASSGGYVLDGHQNTNFKAISSQRPLVDLSEAEASRTCSALKRRRNSASGLWHSGKINARMLLCVFCLIPFIR